MVPTLVMPAWSAPVRSALAAGGVVAAFALVVAAKRAFLAAYLAAEPWSGVLALGSLAAATEGVRRLLRASSLAAWGVGVPALAVLAVLVLSTPLPYELAAEAARLPHPEGTARPPVVEASPVFERRHPVVTAVFRYAPERDLAALTNGTVSAFERDGWTVLSVRRPAGEAGGDFGYVAASKGRFEASCTLGARGGWSDWDGPMMTVGCRLTV